MPSKASTRAAPLFYLAGFGGSATGDIGWAAQVFQVLNLTHDLVFVDQRGTGHSDSHTCPAVTGTTSLADPASVRAWVHRCLAGAKDDPRHDTTASAVQDLERVRTALGYGKISLYGASYGVTMGLAYLQRYGDHVESAVLDSGSLLNVRLWQIGPTSAQQAFDQVAQRCQADPACAAAYQPEADLKTVIANLRSHPVTVSAPIGPGGKQQTVTIDLNAFLNLVTDGYLSSATTAALLPEDLHAAAQGQWASLVQKRASELTATEQANGSLTAQQITLICSDEWAAMDPTQVSAQTSSVFTPEYVNNADVHNAICAQWPHDSGVSGTVTTDAQVLFLNGTADPNDPPANVAAAPTTMPNALMISIPGGGHGVMIQTHCVWNDAMSFLVSGVSTSGAWSTCLSTVPVSLPPFAVG